MWNQNKHRTTTTKQQIHQNTSQKSEKKQTKPNKSPYGISKRIQRRKKAKNNNNET